MGRFLLLHHHPPFILKLQITANSFHNNPSDSVQANNMQLFKTILIAAFLAATASASFPSCAEKCFAVDEMEASGCNTTDRGCLCNNQKFKDSAKKCVQSSCSLGDQLSMMSLGSLYNHEARGSLVFRTRRAVWLGDGKLMLIL